MSFSKHFQNMTLLCILLNLLHGLEVSQTKFFVTNPNFYFYTHYFKTIPEAVYYVQHGFLYGALIIFLACFVLGKKFKLVPLIYFGLLLVSETHHFFRSIFSFSYQSGMITSGLFIIASIFYIQALILEIKNGILKS
jgi:hypothetical protein